MPVVIADTDFLSSFLKIERLDLVRSFFQVETISVPPAVYREIAVTSLLPRLTELSWVQVREIASLHGPNLAANSEFVALGSGEQEAITLATSLANSVLLMNDRRAGSYARSLGVDVVNIPAFLLAWRKMGVETNEVMQELVDALREKDHYVFSESIRRQLFR